MHKLACRIVFSIVKMNRSKLNFYFSLWRRAINQVCGLKSHKVHKCILLIYILAVFPNVPAVPGMPCQGEDRKSYLFYSLF